MLPKKNGDVENSLFNDVLNALGYQLVVVRGERCNIIYMNAAAQNFFKEKGLSGTSCRSGYSNLFAEACEKCPHKKGAAASAAVEVDGLLFHFSASTVNWLDGKPATLLLYKQHQASAVDQRLFSLAYMDSLTGIPNRLKLQEDFGLPVLVVQAGSFL